MTSHDKLTEAFDAISSPDLREAIVEAVLDAQFVENVLSGGADGYVRTAAGAQKSKPESKVPTGVEYAKHFRAIIGGFRSVSHSARIVEVRIDELRDVHDGRETSRQKRSSVLRVVRGLTKKVHEAGIAPAEDERG